MLKHLLFSFLIFSITEVAFSQCGNTTPISLIPNPSFENYSTCPTSSAQLDRATGWIQASAASTDYYNCTHTEFNAFIPPSTPYPHGTGYIGIWNNGNWKEYAGACLTGNMIAGTSYTLQFQINTNSLADPTFGMSLFGTQNCSNLPFTNTARDCPSNYLGWTELSTQIISVSTTSWTTVTMTFIPATNISVIALGPNCIDAPNFYNYYYVDNLTLNLSNLFPAPLVDAGDTIVNDCSNNATTLAASVTRGLPGFNYVWTPSSGLSSPTSPNPLANPNSTTMYTVTVTDTNGCTGIDSVLAIVDKSSPIANAGPDITIDCLNSLDTLSGSGGTSYVWNTPDLSGNDSIYPLNHLSIAGEYILSVSAANGCTANDTAYVTMNNTLPVADAGADQIIDCAISSVILDGTGSSSGVGYLYAWTGSPPPIPADSIATTANQPGAYILTVSSSNNCTNSDTVNVLSNLIPPGATAGTDQTITCATPTASLQGSVTSLGVDYIYNWSTTNGTFQGTVTNETSVATTNGIYLFTVTDTINNCSTTDTALVIYDTISPTITVSVNHSGVLDCNNTILQIIANPVGTNTFSWSTSDGNITSGTNLATISVDLNGTYDVAVLATNGCNTFMSQAITIDTLVPVFTLTEPDTLTCINQQTGVGLSTLQIGNSFIWSTADGLILTGAQTDSITVSKGGGYTVVVTSPNGCASLDSVVVIVDTLLPLFSINIPDTLTCIDSTVNLSISPSQNNVLYQWSTSDGVILNGSQTNSPVVTAEGTYQLLLTSTINGCASTTFTNVVSAPLPTASILVDSTTGNQPFTAIFFSESWGQNLEHHWTSELANESYLTNPSFVFNDAGTYYVTLLITDGNGCTDLDSVLITVLNYSDLVIPNIFTPNGDHVNDLFKISAKGTKTINGLIYDRWGGFINEWSSTEAGWDGTTKANSQCSNGVYYYVIDVTFMSGVQKKYAGHVRLNR